MKMQTVHRGLYSHPDYDDHEAVSFVTDADSGLKAIIAVHDTTLGPALGGCRRWAYESEAAALTDVLRLSRGMTLKNAAAGLDLGGGKAVILSDGKPAATQTWRAFGRAVNRLGGDYITAEDVGTGQDAVDEIASETAHVRGTSGEGLGDPSPYTAWGVFCGIRAAVRHVHGAETLGGLTLAIQGTGNVGAALARYAHAAGARLVLADIRDDAVRTLADELGAQIETVEAIHAAKAEIFAPCALGGALNARTIPELKAGIVAGAANNQLESPLDAARLSERGIVYAPDFVINAGGVISIALAAAYPNEAAMKARVGELGGVLSDIFAAASPGGRSTEDIAVAIARSRLDSARGIKSAGRA